VAAGVVALEWSLHNNHLDPSLLAPFGLEAQQKLANRLVYGERATPHEVLSQFSERVAETYAAEDALPKMARVLAEGTNAERVTVWLRTGEELRPAAAFPTSKSVSGHSPIVADRPVVIKGADLSNIEKAARVIPVQDIEATVYFCVLEALQNVQKYGAATIVMVRLRTEDGEVRFEVEDDGAGFRAASARKGSGLTIMEDRLDALGGGLVVDSAPGQGTQLRGHVPLLVGATS